MRQPLVSVLMTVFNTEAYLKDAIDSIVSQTLVDFELIIIDDGSTDDSWALISAAAARDSRIVPIRCERQAGASCALNAGLGRARGQYITRQDGDDLSLPTRLAEQVSFLEKNPAIGAAGTLVMLIDSEARELGVTTVPETNSEIQSALLDYMCFCGPTVMARRSAFAAIGLTFDETLSGSEDYDLCLRLAEVTELANVKDVLYLYRQHASSVSHAQRSQQLARKARALEKAIHRRFGPAPSPANLANVARDYLRAAVIAHLASQDAGKRECLNRALALDAKLFENTRLLETVVRRYTPASTEAALTFTDSVFDDLLPSTRPLAQLRRQLIAELHMKEAFASAGEGQGTGTMRHLYLAIRRNPAWLANRGVLSLLVRNAFGQKPAGRGAAALKARTPS